MRAFILFSIFPALLSCDAPSTAAMSGVAEQASSAPAPEDCRGAIKALIARAPLGRSRVVITFTGTQEALMPVWEATSAGPLDSTLIPLKMDAFVLTIQARPINAQAEQSARFADQVCSVAERSKARFNGVLLLEGNSMIDAAMAKLSD